MSKRKLLETLAAKSAFKVSIESLDKEEHEDPIVLKVTVGGDFEEKVSLEIEFLEK